LAKVPLTVIGEQALTTMVNVVDASGETPLLAPSTTGKVPPAIGMPVSALPVKVMPGGNEPPALNVIAVG
jgi:hypothetical protein